VGIFKLGAVLLVALALLNACVMGEGYGPPPPSDSATVSVDLAPGESHTFEFDVEAETFETGETFYIDSPISRFEETLGVAVRQSWSRDGKTENGWPTSVELERGTLMNGVLSITLTNQSQTTSQSFDLAVEIYTRGALPQPRPEDLRLDIEAVAG
jgi:hypothetical protein